MMSIIRNADNVIDRPIRCQCRLTDLGRIFLYSSIFQQTWNRSHNSHARHSRRFATYMS